MSNQENNLFIIQDKLPLVSDVIVALLKGNKSRNVNCSIYHADVQNLSKGLVALWSKIFSNKVLTPRNVNYHIKKHYTNYLNHVAKKSKAAQPQAFIQWRNKHDVLFDILAVQTKSLTQIQLDFYHDQRTIRTMRYSDITTRSDEDLFVDDINLIDEVERMSVDGSSDDGSLEDGSLDNGSSDDESSDNDDDDSCLPPEGYHLRSGVHHPSPRESIKKVPQLSLKEGSRNFSEKVLRTITALTTVANCTIPQARMSFQIVSNLMFDQNYTLEATEKTIGVPRTKEDFLKYENVVPSTKVLYKHLHVVAIQRELQCAQQIISAPPDTVITIGYDSTTRSGLKNEWVSFVVHFSDRDEKFRLRPLYMAFENKENTAKIFVEQFKRLGFLVNVSPKIVFERINAIMTDSVAKMIGIEDIIAEKLQSYHKPFHLLCVSHTVEGFTRAQLEVIGGVSF